MADTLKMAGKEKYIQQVQEFVKSQVSVMPDFLRFGIMMMTIVANYLFLFFNLRTFANLSEKSKRSYFNLFGRVKFPILSNLYRFYSSLIILKTLELETDELKTA